MEVITIITPHIVQTQDLIPFVKINFLGFFFSKHPRNTLKSLDFPLFPFSTTYLCFYVLKHVKDVKIQIKFII